MGVLQLDSVNVFCRTHYMPAFSRLGAYPRALLDTLAAHTDGPVRRELFEYWAHEASLVPVELQPLLRWRMDRANADAWGGMRRVAQDNPGLVDEVLLGAEVGGEAEGCEGKVAEACGVEGGEEAFDACVAEEVDGLAGVAD